MSVTIIFGVGSLSGFLADSRTDIPDTRTLAARRLAAILRDLSKDRKTPPPTLAVVKSIRAPYNLPPVDLIGWHIVRLPRVGGVRRAVDGAVRDREARRVSLALESDAGADQLGGQAVYPYREIECNRSRASPREKYASKQHRSRQPSVA